MKTNFNFQGMIVPVFTPFNTDTKYTVNYDVVDKYAQHLKSTGMQGVFVNSITGEGSTLTVQERKTLAEKWYQACQKYGMKMFVNIGGCPLPEVYELAQHAEQYKFDAVMVLPDTYYTPKTEQDLVYYLKDVMKYVPSVPMFYYHIPAVTRVYRYINWYYFMQLMEKEVPTFAGLYWADDQVDYVTYLREKMPEYYYIIGTCCSMMAYMAEGYYTYASTVMNLYPQVVKQLYDYMSQYKVQEAYGVKQQLCKSIYGMFGNEKYMDYISTMKMAMDKLSPFKVGPVRKPKMSQTFFYY